MRELNLDHINDYYVRTDAFYDANRTRSADPAYRQKLKDTSYWKGKKMPLEMRKKLSEAAKNRKTSTQHAKYMTDDGVMFLMEAARYYDIAPQSVINRAKSSNPKFKDWYRIDLSAAEAI